MTLLILVAASLRLSGQCNGDAALCTRTYDKVATLTTHNAFNCAEHNFNMPNQTWGITRQLNEGVRGLMIDVYDKNGVTTVYHGFSFLGSQPLSFILQELQNFLTVNPNEIITIIFENHTTANAIDTALTQSGLKPYLFEYQTFDGWPTLQEMIDSGKRLVVFSEKNDGNSSQPWHHYVWDYATETHFSVSDTALFTCDFNRGNPANDLYIFNHFITGTLGTGDPLAAEAANSNPFFVTRVLQCMQMHNKFPNFITVDFYEKGDAAEVVSYLNALSGQDSDSNTGSDVQLWPNPSTGRIYIQWAEPHAIPTSCWLYDSRGVRRAVEMTNRDGILEADMLACDGGFYILQINSASGQSYYFKVVVF